VSRVRALARRLGELEPAVVILAAPLLWFPAPRPAWTAAALAALLAVWLLRWIGTGRPGARSPLDLALLLFALMIPVGVWASAFPAWTVPKLTGLILGLAAFRAVVNVATGARSVRAAVVLFLLLGLALAGVGLLGAFWTNKLPWLGSYTARLPRLIQGLPGAEYGVHPNELGGTMLFFLPVALAAALGWDTGHRGGDWLARGLALLLSCFLLVVLVLSQSRSGWFGAAAGVAAVAWLRWPRLRWPIAAAALALLMVLILAGPQVSSAPGTATSGREAVVDVGSLVERSGPWQRGLDAVARFPLTGVGLGTFREVHHLFGPGAPARPDRDMAHAHNVFLQVALDLGIPGLVAYLALVGTALWCCLRALSVGGANLGWLGAGVAGSLVAFHVYGLPDTIALGAKPGVAFWLLLGLAVAVWRRAEGERARETVPAEGGRA
jgi:putative inorganic carbon (HCO3(-)) transporter